MNRQGIEGIPDHLKVVGVRAVKNGERSIDTYSGVVSQPWSTDSKRYFTVIEHDNVYNVYHLADVEIPEGYEFVEFRDVVAGDSYIAKHRTLIESSAGPQFRDDQRRIIVKPVAKKTRRVLVAEQELYVTYDVKSVEGRFVGSHHTFPVNFRIEEREINQDAYNKGLGELGTY